MSTVQCPVCEFSVELAPVETPATLLQALGVDNAGLDTGTAELQMSEHLQGHTTLEWVTAMRMADLYIEKLEGDANALAHTVQRQRQELEHWKAVGEQKVELRAQARNGALPNGYGQPMAAMPVFDTMSPRQAQEQLARDRRAGLVKPLEDSLIPFIPPGVRAEGVVGRKR